VKTATLFRHPRSAIFCAAISFALSPATLAFGTIHGLGQDAEHERITRAALPQFGPNTLDELAGKSGTFGAVGAPDNPLRGLMSKPDAHCDGADFLDSPAAPASPPYPQTLAQAQSRLNACRNWMIAAIERAAKLAAPLAKPGAINTSLGCVFDGKAGRAKCNVLEQLGLALHASQDFYSHSNWNDRPDGARIGPRNPPGLGQTGRAPWLDLRFVSVPPPGLITGCYDGFPESQYCEYGPNLRVKHEFLNKDKGKILPGGGSVGSTPRGQIDGNFDRAVSAAIDDTADKWLYFQERVRALYGPVKAVRIICVVISDDRKQCP
jgi:hypothetical protein